MFNIMGIIVPVFMLVILGVFAATFIKGVSGWNKNNKAPRLTVPATVVGKRISVSRGGEHHHGSTYYYVTFQVESGDRMELQLQGNQYGLIVEGDHGKLTFQGTRFLNFERT
ncbi:MAG: DUF2500 domain-containing protein [Oscillospiraceae bacterium]|nr:DUF2500 domain-containing protein [Oscillospiraceae bacterium]